MKFAMTLIFSLLSNTVFANTMSTAIHSICLTSDQKYIVVDMTSPILLPEVVSSDDFKFVVSDSGQGGPQLDLFLNSRGGMFSNDRRNLRFEKEKLDATVQKNLSIENMIFVKNLNRTVGYIFVTSCP